MTHPGWPVEVIRQRISLRRFVDREVFNRVATMRRRRSGERQAAGSFLLAGLVYHRTSGTPFTASSTKTASRRYCYYRSQAWAAAQRRLQAERAAADGTPRRRVRPIRASLKKDELEGAVLAQLARAAQDCRVLRRMLEVDREKEAATRVAFGRSQKELRQTEAAVDRFLEGFASGVLHMTETTARTYREIAGRVARLTVEADRLRASFARPRGQERETKVQEALRRLPEQLEEATLGRRRALIAGLISRVWIGDDGRVQVRLRGTDPRMWPPDMTGGVKTASPRQVGSGLNG